MPLLPLKIPAGVRSIGTELENSGRWSDTSLVRWHGGSMRPVGGWADFADASSELTEITTGNFASPRAMHVWYDNAMEPNIVLGTSHDLIHVTSGGTLSNITPYDLTTGINTAAANTGYGGGEYPDGDNPPDYPSLYGRAQASTGIYQDVDLWSLDNWGQELVGCFTADGRILNWDLVQDSSELVTNNSFNDGATGWNVGVGSGWSFSSGSATHTGTTSESLNSDYIDVSDYKTIDVSVTIKIPYSATDPSVYVNFYLDSISGANAIDTQQLTGNGSTSVTYTYTDVDVSYTDSVRFHFSNNVGDGFAIVVEEVSLIGNGEAFELSNAPTNNTGLTVTNERFIFAYGGKTTHATVNPRRVIWCDRENYTDWTPSATNEAGDIELQSNGEIMCGVNTRGGTLIVTTADAHLATYQGPPYVYGFQKVGNACGAISRKSVVAVDAGAYWMGKESFFMFDGSVARQIPCDVQDLVFKNINQDQVSKTFAVHNSDFGEVWWFFAVNSDDPDRYAAYDYVENHWIVGDLDRTTAFDKGVYTYPIYVDKDGLLHKHEQKGSTHGTYTPYAETAPFNIGNGDNVMRVTELIPDEGTAGEVRARFKTRLYPNAEQTDHGAILIHTHTPTSVRYTGRQLVMRVESRIFHSWDVWTYLNYAYQNVEPYASLFRVRIDGRYLGDINNDGYVSSVDAYKVRWIETGTGSVATQAEQDYYNGVLIPYLEDNYDQYSMMSTGTVSEADWRVGTFRINVSEGGRR